MLSTSYINLLKELTKKRMLIVLLLGFSSGLPIMLLYKSLKIWLRREGIDLSTIGYISWVTVPYSFNFIWAFVFDRFIPFEFGRRKSWLLLTQIGLALSLVIIGLFDPATSLPLIITTATILCFFSASQDVVVDAYRREILPDNELGIGAALGVYGYRVAMLVAAGLGLWMVDETTFGISFNQMFFLMAAFMSVGIITTLVCQEPKMEAESPASLKEAVIVPFIEFFKRDGAFVILAFILLYKIGDSMAGSMLSSLYVDVGFTNAQIAKITSGLGFISTMAGLFIGGAMIYHFGYFLPMLVFGIMQSLSTLFFVFLTSIGPNITVLAGVIFFEDFSSGMGTAALVAFMASMTNKKFTATQYALFASLASFGRTFFSGFSGDLIIFFSGVSKPVFEAMDKVQKVRVYMDYGYPRFFIFCAVIALPGLLVLYKVYKVSCATDKLLSCKN